MSSKEVKKVPTRTIVDINAKYEVSVATLLAATLSINEQIENYQVFTNVMEAYPFDDVVAKVFFRGQNAPCAFAMQVKHLPKGETLDVAKYFKGYNKIFDAGGFKTIGDIDVDNIYFSYFCIRNVRTMGYKVLSSKPGTPMSFFGNCFYMQPINETNKHLRDFLERFYLYVHQPDINLIKEEIKIRCKIVDANDILRYVDTFLEKNVLWRQGICKQVFDTELLKIRLSDYILSPADIIQLSSDSQALIWNELTLKCNVTIIKFEPHIEKILYGCFAQILKPLLKGSLDWNTCKTCGLDSNTISEFKKLFAVDKLRRVRHWINPPATLKSLLIELWKSGDLPLILRSDDDLPVLKDYLYLNKNYIIITENLTDKPEEWDGHQITVFTHINDIAHLQMRDELLKTISVSLQGRKPITLYNILGHNKQLDVSLSCSDILHLMKSRKAFLRKQCLDSEYNMIFLVEDMTSSTEYNDKINDRRKGNITIRCKPTEITKYRNQIAMNPKLHSYEIYHCVASSENENFTLVEGNKLPLRDFFVDQYGESVYNLESEIVPILGDSLRSVHQNYIPRLIRSAVVSKSLFDSRTKGICFFSGDLMYLDVNIKRSMVKMSWDELEEKGQFLNNKNIFIAIESENVDKYWKKALKFECPLLYIWVEDTGMHLRRCIYWKGLSDHISFSGHNISAESFLEEIGDGITVLTGEPGIGKSSLLQSLFKNHGMEKYIIFYNLGDHKVDPNFPLDSILAKFRSTRYSKFLVDLFKKEKDLVILLDSFDEVLATRGEEILDFIRNLVATNAKIIIASRPIANYVLVNNFETNLFKVDILGADDRRKYIKYVNLSEEELITMPREFLENPLYLNFLKIISENKGSLAKINKFDLFGNIIQIKLDQYSDRYFSSDVEADKDLLLNDVLTLHQQLALVRILGVEVVENLCEWKCNKKKLYNQLKLGVILSIDEQCNPTFVHEAFVEYLTADWMIKNNTSDSAKSIYQEMLKQDKLYVLNILCEHLVLHKAVVEENIKEIEIYARDRSHLEITDALGRTAAHMAAAYRKHYLKQKMVFHFDEPITTIIHNMRMLNVNFTSSDILMQWDWVQYINYGNKIRIIMRPQLPTPVMGAYMNCIRQKLCADVELCIEDYSNDDVEKLYKSAMDACDVYMVRDLFFIQDAKLNGVHQASLHQECQALEVDALDLKEINGLTSLHVACIYGNVGAVRKLIHLNRDVNPTDKFGCTPLHYCVINPAEVCLDMAKVLLENGSTVNIMNKWKTTPVNIAMRSGNVNIVELLLKTRAPDLNMLMLLLQNEKNVSICAMQLTIAPGEYIERLVKPLLAKGINLDDANEGGETALLAAVKRGNLDHVKLLLEYGADVNSPMVGGVTSLMCASKIKNLAITELLLVKGANVNSTTTCGETALMFATERGMSDVVKILLSNGADVNSATTDGKTPLMFASERGNLDVVTMLLKYGANVRCTTTEGKTPLMFAVEKNNTCVIKLLLEKGANVNSRTKEGKTPLMFASENYDYDVVKILLECGADVNGTKTDSKTPLMLASERGNSHLVQILLEYGADVNNTTTEGKIPLMFASENDHYDVVKILLECEADVHDTKTDSKTPLMLASERGNLSIVQILLEHGADVNNTTADGRTSLMLTVEKNNTDVTKLLLEKGAKINSRTKEGKTPLMFACENDNYDLVKMLLEYGADVNNTKRDSKTPLMSASERGNSDLVKILLEYGADVDKTTADGRTPLMFASENDNYDVVKMLLKLGVDIESTTTDGKTALMLAIEKSNTDVIKLLLEKDANVNSRTNEGKTPLMFASDNDNYDVLKMLLEYGADVNSTETDSKTPLMSASERGNSKLVEILLEYGAHIDSTTTDGKTPLMLAVEKNNIGVIKVLLEKDANVNNRTKEGKTSLMFACENDNYDLVKMLLDYGADVNSTETDSKTSLMSASERGNSDLVNILLEYGADVDNTTTDGRTPLMFATENDNYDVVKMLLEYDADVNGTKTDSKTPLIVASERGNSHLVQILLEYGADVDNTTTDGRTPLMFATENDNYDVVKMLLEYGADVNGTKTDSKTPLILASERGNSHLVQILLEYGADVDNTIADGRTPLMFASENDNYDVVKMLLKFGVDIGRTTTDGKTALMLAIEKNNTDVIKLLLEKDANVNSRSNEGKTPLMFASDNDNYDVVKMLLEYGADVNSTETDSKTTLMSASERGNSKLVEILLEYGAHIDSTTTDGKTPLMLAVEKNNIDVIKILLEKDANVNSRTKEGKTPLKYAIETRSLDIVKLLLEGDAKVNSATQSKTALMYASELALTDAVKLLLETVEDVNSATATGKTALMYACESNNITTVMVLLEAHADVDRTTIEGKTALMYASETGNLDTVKLLLEHGADANDETIYGRTPLTFACEKGDLDVINLLLEKDAKMNCVTTHGETLLMHASKNGKSDLINFLLKNTGHSVNSATTYGETALMYACKWKNLSAVELLLENSASVDKPTTYGLTSLMYACQMGELNLVELLLNKNANVNSATLKGETPLMFAVMESNQPIVELLLKHKAEVNSTTAEGITPLIFACREGNISLVELLINEDAKVNSATKDGDTALAVACREYNLDIIRLLVKGGADTQSTTIDGKTLFVYACEGYMEELIRLLIENGVDVNSRTEDWDTPLIIACQMNDLETVKLLLEKDCDVNALDVNGRSALYFAINYPSHCLCGTDLDIIRLLLGKNAHIDDECYEAAIKTENSTLIEMLDEKKKENKKNITKS